MEEEEHAPREGNEVKEMKVPVRVHLSLFPEASNASWEVVNIGSSIKIPDIHVGVLNGVPGS